MTSLLSKFKTDSDSETDVDVDKEPLGRKRVPDSRSGIPMMNKNSNNAQSQNIENLKKNSSEPVEALKGSIEESVELKQTKKKRKVFDEKVLTSRDGLLRIYEDFPSACKFRGRGYEAQDIKLLMNKYREWGFQLYPSLAFTDLLSRCETLGSKATVRACAENLRDRERTRYLNQVLGVPLSSILRPVTTLALDDEVPMDDLQDLTSPEAGSPPSSGVSPNRKVSTASALTRSTPTSADRGANPAPRPSMTPAALDPWDEDFDYEELLRIEQDAIRQVQQADEQMKLSQQEQRSEEEEEVMSLDGSDSDEDMIAEVEMEGTQTHALPAAGSDSEEEAQLEEPTQPQ